MDGKQSDPLASKPEMLRYKNFNYSIVADRLGTVICSDPAITQSVLLTGLRIEIYQFMDGHFWQ